MYSRFVNSLCGDYAPEQHKLSAPGFHRITVPVMKQRDRLQDALDTLFITLLDNKSVSELTCCTGSAQLFIFPTRKNTVISYT